MKERIFCVTEKSTGKEHFVSAWLDSQALKTVALELFDVRTVYANELAERSGLTITKAKVRPRKKKNVKG